MIYTIGHSTMSAGEFVHLVEGKIQTVVDVRSHPTSKWEQFRKEEMQNWLQKAGVGYEWWPELGGWDKRHLALKEKFPEVDLEAYAKGKFPKQRIAKNLEPPAEQLSLVKPEWTNVGLKDYSAFMSLDEFLVGADKLIQRGQGENVGILCCEVLPWKCHRSMVADYLAFRGMEAVHLQPRMTPHSKMLGNRLDRYSEQIVNAWTEWRGRDATLGP